MSASFSFEVNSFTKKSLFKKKYQTWWVHQRTSLQILWREIFCKIDYFECMSKKKKFLRVCLLEGEQLLCCWHLWLWGQRGQNQNFSWITSDTPPTLRRRAGFDSAFFSHFRKSQSNAQRIEEIESSERKNNLIIKGIKQERRLERPSHLQGMIKKFFKQTLKLSGVQLEEVRHSVFFQLINNFQTIGCNSYKFVSDLQSRLERGRVSYSKMSMMPFYL